jgi:hypothetical protein
LNSAIPSGEWTDGAFPIRRARIVAARLDTCRPSSPTASTWLRASETRSPPTWCAALRSARAITCARNGAQDARDASASSNGDTASTAADTRVPSEWTAGWVSASSFPAPNWGLRHCDQLILITQTPPDERRGPTEGGGGRDELKSRLLFHDPADVDDVVGEVASSF